MREYLDSLPTAHKPTTWLMGVLATKDAAGLLAALLRRGDRLCTVPIDSHSAYAPDELVEIAKRTQPMLEGAQTLGSMDELPDYLARLPASEGAIVLCGSLYLLGEVKTKFLRSLEGE
ncbi:MAG: hypothetical protein AAFY15_01430 [Cyanobacteria bacterium J06648_11]